MDNASPNLMAKNNSSNLSKLRVQRRSTGLTSLGLPPGYRDNPVLLQGLPDEPRRGFSLRNPANWVEKECLYCGAMMVSNRRTFCSKRCRHSYEFRQKNPLLAV